MARSDFAEVRAAIIDENQAQRGDLRMALAAKGIPNPIVCRDPDSFLSAVANESLDVIVCDANTMGDGFASTVQRIRRNDMGGNPFAIVIGTLHDATMDGVRTAMDSGVDHLLLKPAPVARIVDRIDHMIWERQPFVVTKGYVGPSRRSRKRANDDKNIVLNIPNTLRGKVVEKVGAERVQRMITQGVASLEQKMEKHPLLGIDRLVQRTIAYSQNGFGADGLKRDFAFLMEIGVELSQRYRGTAYAHIAELAVALADLASRIATKAPQELRSIDLAPLSDLGEIIRRAVAAEELMGSGEQVPEMLGGAVSNDRRGIDGDRRKSVNA
ncbi:MAG TPA: response regulator [Magnetospirillaceae bacterium]|jgi:DNA-binding response OmpR family regulator